MALRHKVKWAVYATPKVNVDLTAGGNLNTITLHEDIRRSLGGSGELDYDGAIDYGGVTDGSTSYLNASSSGVDVGDGTTRFIWIKHSGYLYASSAKLGLVTSDNVEIFADNEHIASLKPGEGWIIPLPDTSSNVSNFKVKRADSRDIAIEAIGLD